MRFLNVIMCVCAGVVLTSCKQAAKASDLETSAAQPLLSADVAIIGERAVEFQDILSQYQSINQRLERVASKLQNANVDLCPAIKRDVGFSVHTLKDYPEELRLVARSLLNVDEGLSIRTVRKGSTAQTQGLLPGDRLVSINQQRLVSGATQLYFYDRVSSKAFKDGEVNVTIVRDSALKTVTLDPQDYCDYPAHVIFDEEANAHTDGQSIWVTSQLMRNVDNDDHLSLIVAHEMAHAIAMHPLDMDRQSIELEADKMALIMLARAGLDIDAASEFWTVMSHPHHDLQDRSESHPSIAQRDENLRPLLQRIKKAQSQGRVLDFTLMDAAN